MRTGISTLLLGGALALATGPAEAQDVPFTFDGEVLIQNASAFPSDPRTGTGIVGHVVCKVCRGSTCSPEARLEDTLRDPTAPGAALALGIAPLQGDPMSGSGIPALEDGVYPFSVEIHAGGLPYRYDSGWPVPLTEADSYVCYLELLDVNTEQPPQTESDFERWGAPWVPTVGNPEPVRNAVPGAPIRVIASGPIP